MYLFLQDEISIEASTGRKIAKILIYVNKFHSLNRGPTIPKQTACVARVTNRNIHARFSDDNIHSKRVDFSHPCVLFAKTYIHKLIC